MAGLPDTDVWNRALSSTERLSPPLESRTFATIRSGLPSPFTSAVVTQTGTFPALKVRCSAKLAFVAPGVVVFISTDTLLSLEFLTIRSGLPSPFTSATVTDSGPRPVGKVCWGAKLGVVAPGAVVLSSTEIVSPVPNPVFATIRSGLPSPFTSATVRDFELLPAIKFRACAKLSVPMVVVFRNTDMSLLTVFAAIRSGLPSPFTSATVTDSGNWSAVRSSAGPKVTLLAPGEVVFTSTDTLLVLFATITSGLPSPFRSATASPNAPFAIAKSW